MFIEISNKKSENVAINIDHIVKVTYPKPDSNNIYHIYITLVTSDTIFLDYDNYSEAETEYNNIINKSNKNNYTNHNNGYFINNRAMFFKDKMFEDRVY